MNVFAAVAQFIFISVNNIVLRVSHKILFNNLGSPLCKLSLGTYKKINDIIIVLGIRHLPDLGIRNYLNLGCRKLVRYKLSVFIFLVRNRSLGSNDGLSLDFLLPLVIGRRFGL